MTDNLKKGTTIIFEQQGKHLFEGELFCEVCGFRGKADLDTVFAHKRGFHLVNTATQSIKDKW